MQIFLLVWLFPWEMEQIKSTNRNLQLKGKNIVELYNNKSNVFFIKKALPNNKEIN